MLSFQQFSQVVVPSGNGPPRFSVGVPFWATRASALRAWDASGMGYLRSSGMANVEFFIRLRLLILLMVSPFR